MLFFKYFIGRSINEYYNTVLFTFSRKNSHLGIPVKSINKGTSEILAGMNFQCPNIQLQ